MNHKANSIENWMMRTLFPRIVANSPKTQAKDHQRDNNQDDAMLMVTSNIFAQSGQGPLSPPPSPAVKSTIRSVSARSTQTSPTNSVYQDKNRSLSFPIQVSPREDRNRCVMSRNPCCDVPDMDEEEMIVSMLQAPPSTPVKNKFTRESDSFTPRNMKHLHVKLAPLMLPSSLQPTTTLDSPSSPPLPPIAHEVGVTDLLRDELFHISPTHLPSRSPCTPVFNEFAMVETSSSFLGQQLLEEDSISYKCRAKEMDISHSSKRRGSPPTLPLTSNVNDEVETNAQSMDLGMHFRMSED